MLKRLSRTLARELDMSEGGGPQAPPGVAGRGLDEEPPKRTLAPDAPVGDAVEGDAAGHAEIRQTRLLVKPAGLLEQDLFQDGLKAAGHAWWKRAIKDSRGSGRLAEEIGEGGRVHPAAADEVEVVEVEPVMTARTGDQEPAHRVQIPWRAVGREAHHLVLAGR